MRTALITLCALSALLAACDVSTRSETYRSDDGEGRAVLRVIDALQCPDTIGSLTRKGSAQDGGRVCTYGGPRGAEVSLHLVSVDDESPDKVLQAFEDQLAAAMPETAAQMGNDQAEADAQRAMADAERADADARAAADDADAAARDAAEASAQAGDRTGDRASVRMPGLSVEAQGEKAEVRMPGMTVDADGDKARVRIGGFSIDANEGSQAVAISSSDESVSVQAHDNAAEIRTRAPGSATRVTYILTDNTASAAGWRLVGYEARGPQGGPIVVATVRAKDRDNDGVFDDAKDLVTLNVGE